MDSVSFPEEPTERKVSIVGSELVDNYTVYIIEVTDGEHKWTTKHRYSDFHELHEKLTAENKVDKHLLPPKKILGKNSRSLVERRQKDLEVYLQTLLTSFPTAAPKALSCFMHFNLYEINGVTAALAEELFHKGEQLLVAGEVFCLRPLQLYSVSQQLRLAKPTCCTGDAKTDLGHILDFTCRLRYLKVTGTRGPVGTSNIQEIRLPFDLSIFRSLLHIEISECSWQQIGGFPSLRSILATLSIHHSTDTMMSILVPEASEFSQWEVEGGESCGPVTAVIPLWSNLTTLDMSYNTICTIDSSVKVIPKVEFLDLSHNLLSSIDNLQHLYNLVHVDLSYNDLRVLEGAHTRLGNIKTLNLAGNQLDRLTGLSKLYSLVNLDLSSNQLAHLEEIGSIGSLPCLEKLNLSNNPVCIIPDYRTKVLAQFLDRASEVCLDGRVTTEKELDTVEVLKAIQKAKDVKKKMNNSDKKISEETRPPHLTLSSTCSSSAVAPSAVTCSSSPSCQAQQVSSSSQEVNTTEKEVVSPSILPPMDPVPPPTCSVTNQHHQLQVPSAACLSASTSSPQHTYCNPASTTRCICSCDRRGEGTENSFSTSCPILPSHLLSFSSSNKEFIVQLSRHVGSILKQQEEEEEVVWEGRRRSSEPTEVGSSSPSSCPGDGYFEMGLDDSLEEASVSSHTTSTSLPAPLVDAQGQEAQEKVCEEQNGVQISGVLWCLCVRVENNMEQRGGCLVLTDKVLGLFYIPADSTLTNEDTEREWSPGLEEVLSSLQKDLLVPYTEVVLSSKTDLPDSCLALGVRSGRAHWYLFSDPQNLRETRTQLTTLLQLKLTAAHQEPTQNPLLFTRSLLSSWELEECQGAQGGYPAHLLLLTSPSPDHPSPRPDLKPLLTDIFSQKMSSDSGEMFSVPSLLFLTARHLCVLKVDFTALADSERSQPGPIASSSPPSSSPSSSSWGKVIHVPLGSVALHPRNRAHHSHHLYHVVDLLLSQWSLQAIFPFAQHRLSFLEELMKRRAFLEGMKMLALPRTLSCCLQPALNGARDCCPAPSTTVPPSSDHSNSKPPSSHRKSPLLQRLAEENQPSPHLSPGLSPALKVLAGLRGEELAVYFQQHIAQSEGEEVRQVMWLSVVLYKSPEVELTSCLLLSTNAIYFLLEDSASSLSHHTLCDISEPVESEVCPCCCVSIRLCDLQSVNVGLFDQFFRLVGKTAEQIVCCVNRDSYGTAAFLQELMAALSLQVAQPPPQPSEQDFYSHFSSKGTGKIQNYELIHSSKVKFIYPSEEEMGDLTFIVAERRTLTNLASSSSHSVNILLYLLVFQVQTASNSSTSAPSPVLQPRTLILTSTDIFLLDEDYVSYPLPDFAKEPPSRERYQLRETRRIRDVDRVLLGYQTYPQALTLVFDDLPGPDLLCHLTMDHFTAAGGSQSTWVAGAGAEGEVQWCIFVPGADSRERLICLLARQWEALCSRELPVELTG
ncbi:nischarin [Lampris incognitus]|uniref:nischarin n=1 Tax=Lampris incognitus TaxID=2546036 RepID=UPI0024B5526A|nr:nischarin [Lampris incognitus]